MRLWRAPLRDSPARKRNQLMAAQTSDLDTKRPPHRRRSQLTTTQNSFVNSFYS